MEDGLLSLKWNNHRTTFFDILRQLREKSNYTDATLAVDGKFYPVHKLVLSTCSEYFCDIFERTPCKAPVIVLKDVRSQDLEALLDYMYLGEVNVNQHDLACLLKTAECLRIKGLAVPDEEQQRLHPTWPGNKGQPSQSHQPSDDRHRDTPPAKRRRQDDTPPSTAPPQPVSPSRSLQGQVPSSTQPSSKQTTSTQDTTTDSSSQAMVKVELEEVDDRGETYSQDDNFDGTGHGGEDSRDFPEVEKTELDINSSNYPVSQQPDISWGDDSESANYSQEGFVGDGAGQQSQGGGAAEDDICGTQPAPPSTSYHTPEYSPPAAYHGIASHASPSLLVPSIVDVKGSDGCSGSPVVMPASPVALMRASDVSRSIAELPPLHTLTGRRPTDGTSVRAVTDFNLPLRHDLVRDQRALGGGLVCCVCAKTFYGNSEMKKHLRIHTGEKPYECSRCPYKAKQKAHLESHLLRRHSDQIN